MKHQLIKLSLLLLVTFTCFGCKKYLDEKSNKSLVTPSTLEDLQALLDDAVTMNTTTPGFMETCSDDYFLLPATYNSLVSAETSLYSYIPFAYTYANDWSKAYQVVYNANVCLENLNDIASTATNKAAWENVKGSALFFRSYYYLLLAWQHAKAYDQNTADEDLGIVLRSGSDFNVKSVRASVRDTYAQIINDIKTAALSLPDNPIHVMRPSKAAAYGLLARTYLSMRMPDSAFKYADLSLRIKSSLINYNGDTDINGTISATTPFKKFNKETVFYSEMYSSFALHIPSRGKIDSILYAKYDNNDLRKTAFFRANTGYQQFKGSYAASASVLFSGIGVDELYLIRAECHARLNRTNEAMADLNTLLKTRWKSGGIYPTLTASNATDALNIILLERRKELLMRGLRWIDIKRLNKDGANIIPTRVVNGKTFTLQPNSSFYALPLPDDIIRLTGIEQN
jgi:hypothetical protein